MKMQLSHRDDDLQAHLGAESDGDVSIVMHYMSRRSKA